MLVPKIPKPAKVKHKVEHKAPNPQLPAHHTPGGKRAHQSGKRAHQSAKRG